MRSKEERRLIALGKYPNCSYVATLPLNWIRKNKLRKQQRVTVREDTETNTVVISVQEFSDQVTSESRCKR